MKNILLVLAFIAVITTTGCHKDNDAPATVSTTIIGKWKTGSALAVYYTAGKEIYRETVNAPAGAPDGYMEFRANNVYADFSLNSNGTTYTETDGTYALLNNDATLRLTIQGYSEEYTFALQNNNAFALTINVPGAGVTFFKNNGTIPFTADNAVITGNMVRF